MFANVLPTTALYAAVSLVHSMFAIILPTTGGITAPSFVIAVLAHTRASTFAAILLALLMFTKVRRLFPSMFCAFVCFACYVIPDLVTPHETTCRLPLAPAPPFLFAVTQIALAFPGVRRCRGDEVCANGEPLLGVYAFGARHMSFGMLYTFTKVTSDEAEAYARFHTALSTCELRV